VRPSVVIGESRTGRYQGKRYGLYQLWYAAERLMCVKYLPRIYAIAPRVRIPVIHQDAFQNGFLAAYRSPPPNGIFHLVSRDESLPTVRDIWDQWLLTVSRPREIYYFERWTTWPMEKLSRQQQLWVELTGVNLDISSRPWQFETTALDRQRRKGLSFADATADTIRVCQNRSPLTQLVYATSWTSSKPNAPPTRTLSNAPTTRAADSRLHRRSLSATIQYLPNAADSLPPAACLIPPRRSQMLRHANADSLVFDGPSRRNFLQLSGLGALGLFWADLRRAAAVDIAGRTKPKSVIMIFNAGAPSHIDLWDPKPDAPRTSADHSSQSRPMLPGFALRS